MLVKIDELVIGEHYYLSGHDDCFYFKEYTAGGGFSASSTNSLIYNFKKSPDKKDQPGYHYKARAISQVVTMFRESLPTIIDLTSSILVPIPPSKLKTDPLYDDRMLQTLLQFAAHTGADVRELILLRENMQAVHESAQRPHPAELQLNFQIDNTKADGLGPNIYLFDDLVTTGSHFVACRNLLLEQFPDKNIKGIFIARRALPPELLNLFQDLLG